MDTNGDISGIREFEVNGSTWGYSNVWFIPLKNNLKNMNLKEKFALVFKPEPQKSFIKAGITYSNENLTPEGVDARPFTQYKGLSRSRAETI